MTNHTNPLAKFIKDTSYFNGYKAGRKFQDAIGKRKLHHLQIKLTAQQQRVKKIKVRKGIQGQWGIYNGKILLLKMFNSQKEAQQHADFLAGLKSNTFKVIQL